ncbi:MAG: MBL fold metallo-hydrolase [Kiritimatiellae bacterium]|nr:MBL fold metallo-hydrolase [Kiritimatiellia bacterium]
MQIQDVDVTYLSHVCFRFKSPRGKTLITDPMYAPEFPWEGHIEKYLSPPAVPVADIRACDAVFVSHIHGDHFDPDAVLTIQKNTGAKVIAPPDVLDKLRAKGADKALLFQATDGAAFAFGDLRVRTFGGYDNSFDEHRRCNKFAILIDVGHTSLFYSGDCHELPPGVRGTEVDALFSWPQNTPELHRAFCADIKAKRFVIMHCDRFAPGDFLCNMDPEDQKRRLDGLVPGLEIVVPVRAETL